MTHTLPHHTLVHQLRREGRLEEARAMAQLLMAQDAESRQHRRAMAWVLESDLRTQCTYADREAFGDTVHAIRALDLAEDEQMLWEQMAWSGAKLLFSAGREEQVDFGWLTRLVLALSQLPYARPSRVHSVLLKALLKFSAWPEQALFIEQWMEAGLQAEDMEPELLKDGKSGMSLAERVYNGWSKALLRQHPPDPVALQAQAERLERWQAAHPRYSFLPFYRARVLVKLERREEALRVYAPFAEARRNEFWVWTYLRELLSGSWEDDAACLARALRCKAPEPMLVRVREDFAALLIARERWDEARGELERLVHTRRSKHWPIPARVQRWMQDARYALASAPESLQGTYAALCARAELRVEAHLPAELAVVTGFDVQKQLVFVTLRSDRRMALPLRLCAAAREGEVWRLRLQADGKRVQRAERWTGEAPAELLRRFEGKLQQKPSQRFAFAGGVFIPEPTLRGGPWQPGDEVAGWALRVYNPAKEAWGWRACSLQKSSG